MVPIWSVHMTTLPPPPPLVVISTWRFSTIQQERTRSRDVGEVGWGGSEQGAALHLHTVEKLPFLYAVSIRANVITDTVRSCSFENRQSACRVRTPHTLPYLRSRSLKNLTLHLPYWDSYIAIGGFATFSTLEVAEAMPYTLLDSSIERNKIYLGVLKQQGVALRLSWKPPLLFW